MNLLRPLTLLLSVLIFLCSSQTYGLEEFFDIKWVDDTASQQAQIKNDQKIYRDQNRSLIKWNEIDTKEWLNLRAWAKDRIIKDKSPDWIINRKDLNHVELMGRMLDCIGECRIYRGRGHANGQYLSSIKEGDEISTMANSYAWIFMFDGTLVRLSPLSSISVKEINIGKEKIFLHVRINTGNVLWLSRSKEKLHEIDARETDTLFLPLQLYGANDWQPRDGGESSKSLFEYIEKKKDYKKQYQRANKLLAENNKFIGAKKTQAFLVMSNGTIYGENLQLELTVLLGDKSYIKNRSQSWYLQSDSEVTAPKFLFRGYNKVAEETLVSDQWYEVAKNGKNLNLAKLKEVQAFLPGEYVTKRLGSIFVARELLLKKYSKALFDNSITKKDFGLKYNYRRWGKVNLYRNKAGNLQYSKNSNVVSGPILSDEFEKRLEFLKEFTRRTETTGILVRDKFRRRSLGRGELIESFTYGAHFYEQALANYVSKEGRDVFSKDDEQMLNSTTRPLWQLINRRRGEQQ